jgi:NAD+ diphosphatase
MILGQDGLVNFYTSEGFNRAAQKRGDATWITARLNDPATRIHVVWRGRTLIGVDSQELCLLALGDHRILIEEAATIVLLGLEGEHAHVAIDLSHREEETMAEFGRLVDLRSIGPLLPATQAALAAFARGMAHWHSRHLFCGACGRPTRSEQAGHVRRCTGPECGIETFPRIDPAVIMRVTHANRILLGRQAVWPPGMHSVLAGFVETGEALEDAVRRETMEEVGLALASVRYFGSQPWPFPSSLMVGFVAEAVSDVLELDRQEIDQARWYTRDELKHSPEDETFRLPRRDSIAWRLVADWMNAR